MGEFDDEDARFEAQIALVLARLRSMKWAEFVGDPKAAANSPEVLKPVAYAMFEFLLVDVADKHGAWSEFLYAALNEVTHMKGGWRNE